MTHIYYIIALIYAMKTTKTMKKTIRTQNILTINHLLDVTDWKYLRSSPCAASTLSSVASTLASILKKNIKTKMVNTLFIVEVHLATLASFKELHLNNWKQTN